jgi:hypothetical protein
VLSDCAIEPVKAAPAWTPRDRGHAADDLRVVRRGADRAADAPWLRLAELFPDALDGAMPTLRLVLCAVLLLGSERCSC